MSPRHARLSVVLALIVVLASELLVAWAGDARVAHVLLGGQASAPALALAAATVAVRVVAIVLAPAWLLAALASLAAHAVRQREGSSSGAGISVAGGTGASIEGRGTE